MNKFDGTYQELKEKIHLTQMSGNWEDLGNQKRFKANNGAIVNWWESKNHPVSRGWKSSS